MYHGNPAGTGVASSVSSVTTSKRAWTSPTLDGQLYGQPLVTPGRIYVATENDTVYALSASNGSIVWSTHVATAVPASALPCGDIGPTVGITGTPVIDTSRSEIFVVADEFIGGKPAHFLVGLKTTTGKAELSDRVDPAGSTPAAMLQRTGLTLDGGRVIFGFGGNSGDCSTYRGRLVSVAETGGALSVFTVDAASGELQGAIWMGGGAPAVDADGNVWAEAGNGSVTSNSHAYDDSDSVLKLSKSMKLQQFYAPTTWASDNASDADLSMEPALLTDGDVVAAGKQQTAYLLNGKHLGGIGGQLTTLTSVCGGDIDGGVAVVGTTVYLPCRNGPIAIRVTASPPSLHLLWSSGVGGGPPIVAAGKVWTIGLNGTLYGLNPLTGATLQQTSIGSPANHFPTPSIGDGLLLAPSAQRVIAFTAKMSSGHAAAAAVATISTTIGPKGGGSDPAVLSPTSPGGHSAAGITVLAVGGATLLGGLFWLVLSARRRRSLSFLPTSTRTDE